MDREKDKRVKSIRVSAAVIHRDGKIFATKRGYGEYKGKWEFPGGKREEGESGEEALYREIKEELDSKVKIEKLICTTDYDYPTFHLTMDVYLSTLIEGKLTLLEHEDAKWVSLDSIDNLDWLPADWSVIDEIKKHFSDSL
ncbi:MAG: (deoxy)nucleoside triphosphate pyrophosphohydrolase [Spirochaetales bacterium]|nr:(deoxy)nucleoside triphosphate pyrophosphohydrolase [Spirochaetales bacterium]